MSQRRCVVSIYVFKHRVIVCEFELRFLSVIMAPLSNITMHIHKRKSPLLAK